MSRLSEEYLRSPLADVCEENELDLLRGTFSRSSISPDNLLARPPKGDRKISNGSLGGDLYMEATGRRRSSDHGVVLTTDTDSFIIGQKVWVGGIRPGQIAYIGETHFAPGEWAGVVLDEPNGKNDGCVSGKRYFQCEPKKGIFSRLTRLTHYPLPNAFITKESSPSQTNRSILSPERSRATSPTSSIRSSMRRSPGKQGMTVGDRVIVSSGLGSRAGILKYMGETKFAQGTWCGVQLDEPSGKNDGSIDGVRYFECPPKYGVFVPIAKVTISPSSRKSRLSRAGSKESLTSVGTLNSVATTNTSRLRMSAQRIPSATKLSSAPKNTYSLQDVIREKQNHIEQLMIERDLDREDSHSQTMLFQKNISELKNRVVELEKLLEDERKKTEELQYSIDEAQFCGDELNAQTQVYKEKIIELEQRLQNAGIDLSSSTDTASTKYTTEYDELRKENEKLLTEIENMRCKFDQQLKDFESKSTNLNEREQQFHEEIQFLKQENEEMRKELLSKDENTEKLYLTIKELQNTLLEETNAVKKLSDEEEANRTKLLKLCNEKDEFIKQLQSDVEILKGQIDIAVAKNTNTSSCLKQLEDENQSLKDKSEESSREILRWKEIHEKSLSGNDEFQKILSLANEENENLNKIQAELTKKHEALEGALQKKNEEFAELSKTLEEFNKNSENSIKEHEEMKNQLLEASSKIIALESEIVLKEQEAETNKILIEELEKKATKLEDDIKQNQIANSELAENAAGQNEILQKYKLGSESLSQQLEDLSNTLSKKQETLDKLTNEYEEKCKNLDIVIKDKGELAMKSQIERESLTKQISDLEESLKKFENISTNLISTEAKLKETEEQKENLSNDLEKLKLNLSTLSADNTAKSLTIEEQANELKVLTSLSADRQTQCDQLEKTVKELNNLCEILKGAKTTNETKIGELEIETSDKSRIIEALNQKCEEVANQYKTLQQELANLKNTSNDTNSEVVRLTQSLVEKQKNYEELLDNSNTTKNKLERELQESGQNASALEKERNDLKEEMQTKEKSNTELQAQIEALKASDRSKQNEIDSLKEIIESERASANESKSLTSQLDSNLTSLQKEITALECQLKNTKSNSESTEQSLLKQISEYGNEKEQFLNELRNLKDTEVSLHSLLEKQKESEILSMQTFNSQLQSKEEEIVSLNNTIASLKQASNNLNSKASDIESSYVKLHAESESIKLELSTEVAKTKEYTEQIAKLNVALQEKESEKIKLSELNTNLQSQLSSTEDETTSALNNLKLSQNEKEATIENLKTELIQKSNEHAILQTELQQEKEMANTLKKNLEELASSHENGKKQLLEKEKTIKSQSEDIVKLKELIKSLQTDVNNNKQQMAEIIATYTSQIELLNETLSQKGEENSKLLKDSVNLKASTSSENEQLSANLAKEIESQKALSEKYQLLSKEHNSCQARINDLEKLVTDNNEIICDLTMKIARLEESLRDDTNQKSIVKKECEKLQTELHKLNEEKCTTEKSLQHEISKLKSDVVKQSIKEPEKTSNLEQDNSIEQINFLNSIIADMQKKNEALKTRIETLETCPLDFTKPEAFNIVGKRNPAPRLFCDICEIFDAHDTEDCPQQCSDSPPSSLRKSSTLAAGDQNGGSNPTKKLPPPRMFCDICDIFDAHETEDCPLQCF